MCKIDGCDRESMYVEQDVCQKHYFRKMRYGSYEKKKSKYKLNHSGGYIRLKEPAHILADKQGYVYEHRFVYYEQVSKTIDNCALCDKSIGWGNVHIDHIDEDRKNNSVKNLKPLCNGCNVKRNRDTNKDSKILITFGGITQNSKHWAKDDRVNVSSSCIRQRHKIGLSDFDCLFMPKKTHNKNTKNLV